MHAITVTEFGPPEVLRYDEVRDPVAGPGQTVVDVAAADVGWVETLIRRGAAGAYFATTPPYVPGVGVAGTVDGRRVVARASGGEGGYAERVVVDVADLVPVPDGVELTTAAALLTDAVTALRLVELTGIASGDRVLVVGSSGGLGILLVQLARNLGATVVATARDERKLARVRTLGAHAVIDTERPGWVADARAALGGGADVVLDNIGGELGASAFELVVDGGRFSAHGTPGGSFTTVDPALAERRGVTVSGIADVQLDAAQVRHYTAAALAEAAAGRIAPVIGQTYALAEAADAHRGIENRTVFGKTLLIP